VELLRLLHLVVEVAVECGKFSGVDPDPLSTQLDERPKTATAERRKGVRKASKAWSH
jgi:hypothetical protein